MAADQRQKQLCGVQDACGIFTGERLAAVSVEVDANRTSVARLGKADPILKTGRCIAMRAIIRVIDLGGRGADAPASIRLSPSEGKGDLICEIVPPIVFAILAGDAVSDRTAADVFGKDHARLGLACKGEGGEMIRLRQAEH